MTPSHRPIKPMSVVTPAHATPSPTEKRIDTIALLLVTNGKSAIAARIFEETPVLALWFFLPVARAGDTGKLKSQRYL